MKKILLFATLIVSYFSYSQNQTRDIVYLKNGSVIKGSITEMSPSDGIKIKTTDGSLFVYQMSEILKTEKEEMVGETTSQETSSIVGQSTLNDFFSNFLANDRPALKLVGVSKKNGIKKEVFGQKIYEIEYELIMETKSNIYINSTQFESMLGSPFVNGFSYSTKQAGSYETAFAGKKSLIERGKRIIATGTLNFEETDNGWRGSSLRNKTYKTVSSDYVSPAMAEQKKQDNIEIQKGYIKDGDWKKEDISETDTPSFNLSLTDVPLFKNKSIAYMFIKSKSCSTCRNDNIQSIYDVIKKSTNTINRYNSISREDFKASKNNAKLIFSIKDISFKHLGVYESGGNKGFSCTIDYSIRILSKFTDPNTLSLIERKSGEAKGSPIGTYRTKKEAFDGALAKLEKNMIKFMLKNSPYELQVVKVSTDRKGKVENVYLQKPILLAPKAKGDFIIYQRGNLAIKDKKFSIKNTISRCKFKGEVEGDLLKCKVSGGKNKKALLKIVSKETDYMSISSF